MKESQQNTTAPSTDELDNADLSDVELKKTDSPQIPVSSHLVMLLEPIMFVYALYIGAISPLSDQYVRAKISKDYNLTVDYANNSGDSSGYCSNNSNRHMNDEIDSQASLWILYSNIASLLPGIVSLILLGSYSDRGGRKVAIIVPQVGALIRCISVLAIIYFDWPLFVIVIGAFLEGLTGGISMVISAGFSYVADITSNNRSFKMTFLESCFGLGTMVSQVAAGYLIASLGYFYPFLILAIIILLDLGIAACFLPETVTRDPGARFWSLGHFRKAFNLYCRDNGTGRRWKLLLSLSIVFFTCLVTLGRTDVQIFYLLDVPFCWSPVLIGYFGAMFMLIAAPAAVLMTKLTQSTFGDSGLMLIGTISGVAYQAVMAFSVTTLLVFMGKFNYYLCILKRMLQPHYFALKLL